MKKSILLICFILGILFTINAQVTQVKYLIEYNDVTSLYDCKIVIAEGQATTYPQRILFNGQYSIVVPTGTNLQLVELHAPWENNAIYTGTVPCLWEFGPIELSPPIQPQHDFYTVLPNLSPPSAFNDLYTGDTVTVFSVFADVDPCENTIRLFKNGIDPSSLHMPSGGDYSCGYTMGSGTQLYSGNLYTHYGKSYISKNDSLTTCIDDCISLVPTILCLGDSLKYEWSTGETSESIEVCPTEPTNYYVWIKDKNDEILDTIPVHVGIEPLIIKTTNNVACAGQSILLEACPEFGIWTQSSANGFGAVLDSISEGVTEVTFSNGVSGTFDLIFSIPGLSDTIQITVNPAPLVNIAASQICINENTVAAANIPGGTWVSDNVAVATIDPNTGVITGNSAGSVTFSYTAPTGCYTTTNSLLVIPKPIVNVTGSDIICLGGTTFVSPTTGGTWESSNNAIATVTNTGVVTGVGLGITTLIFTETLTGCTSESLEIEVSEMPIPTFTGPDSICVNGTSSISPSTGGVWISSDDVVATIDNSGNITAISAGTVVFTYMNSWSGCSSVTSETLWVFDDQITTTIIDTELCIGETMQALPATNGTWTSADPSIATITANSGLITGISEGTTTFTFTNAATTCSSDPSVEVTVNGVPEVSLQGSNEICIGITSQMLPSSGGTWTSSNPAIMSIDNNGLFTAITEGGPVTFTWTDNLTGCPSLPSEPVFSSLVISTELTGPNQICIGGTTTIEPTTGGTWFSTDPSIATIDNFGNITGVGAGITQFIFTSSAGLCESNPSVPVLVTPSPIINIPTTSLCEDETMILSSTEGGTWTSSIPMVGYIDQTTNIVTALSPGTVTFTFTEDATGCSSTSEIVTVYEKPEIETENPFALCTGLSTTLDPSVGGTWTSSDPAIVTVNNIGQITTISEGTSYLVFTDASSGCESDPLEVIVVDTIATPSPNNNGPLCEGEDIQLTTEFLPGAYYKWTGPNGYSAFGQNKTISNATSADAGTYCLVISYGGCTSESGCTDVVIKSSPITPIANSNGPICEDEDLELTTDQVTGATYEWVGPNGFSSTDQNPIITGATSADNGYYCVLVTVDGCQSLEGCTDVLISYTLSQSSVSNNGPICEGEDLFLSSDAVAGASYLWTGPNGFTSNQQNPTISNANPSDNGTYCLVINIDGCESEPSCTDVIINPKPETPTASYNGPLCKGEDLEISTNAVTDATYAWTGPDSFASTEQNPIITGVTTASRGTYCVIVTVNNCQSDEECIDVLIFDAPATPIAENNGPICEDYDLNLTTDFVAGANYTWTGPNGYTSTNQNPTITGISSNESGSYCVVVTIDGCSSLEGCTDVFINPNPIAPLVTYNGPLCEGDDLLLFSDLVSNAEYLWTGPGGFASTEQNPILPNVHPVGTGTYCLYISVNGCESELSCIDVVINPTDQASTIQVSSLVCIGDDLELNTETLPNGLYEWTGPNGFQSYDQNPVIPSVSSDYSGIYTLHASNTLSQCPNLGVVIKEIEIMNCFEPHAACDEIGADDIICNFNDLAGVSGSLTSENSAGNQPSGFLCNSNDEVQNISWIGFVALVGDYDIVINTSNCYLNNGFAGGVQIGIYTDCSFSNESELFCENNYELSNETRISSSTLTPGQTYFLYIDGFEGSLCDYSIDIDGFYDNTYCTDLSKVTGVAYIDDNENGVYDLGETLLRNALISLSPGNFSVLTNDEGKYIINTPKGGATLTAKMNEGHWINNELTIEDLTIFETCVEGIDFGFVPNLFYQEANVSVANSITRCDWETKFYFTVENTGTINLDANFEFEFDDKASYFSSNLIGLQVNGNEASGNLGTMTPFEVREFWITLKMPPGSTVLPILDFKTTLYNSGGVEMDEYEQSEQLRCSYDPNDKREYPNREGEENLTLMDENLEYTIRFQNNGNDTAFQVKIIDPLDPNIDPTSIRVINSSHAVETCIENENLIFLFENINLVDSMTNYEGSQGFVSFRCNTKEDRLENTIVHNTADIIFDTNEPIVTNTTINTLVSELCTYATSEIVVEICDGDNYHGYEESGTYTEVFPLEYGCDSTVVINLEVQGITYSSQNIEICEGEPFDLNGEEYILYESQVLRDSMENAQGCISNVFIFNVEVNPVLHVEIDTIICEGYEYNGLSESGIYTIESFNEVTGCDIITTIDLEVLPKSDPSCIVGINDMDNSEIKIYPIPAREVFFLEGDAVIDAVSIYTMNYQKVEEIKFAIGLQKIQLSTDKLSQGLYIIAIESKGQIIYKKLIVE